MTDCAVLVPMLGRAPTIVPFVESIRDTSDVRILFICSPRDHMVLTALDVYGLEHIEVEGPRPGDYARKINAGYRHTTERLLFLGAIDLKFHPGWLEAATAKLEDGIGVVGTNDLGSPRVMRGEHSTHSLVTRRYVDEFGTIDQPGHVLHEGYDHMFVDDELVATAQMRGAWAFAGDSHVEHLHPYWKKSPHDEVYARGQQSMSTDRRKYRKRKPLWA